MKKIVSGYLKSSLLVDLNGNSIGESPHITFQVMFPIAREIYISDNKNNIAGDLMEALYRTGYIKNKSDFVLVESDNMIIDVFRKEETYA